MPQAICSVRSVDWSIGTVSATPPVALSASGSQSGTTLSAIAPGSIVITSNDAASQQTAATISRDTASANDGAIVREFDEAKRREIALGFEAARILTGETATFFANRAREADAKNKEADELIAAAGAAEAAGDDETAKRLYGEASALQLEAIAIEEKFGPGGPPRRAFSGRLRVRRSGP